MTRVILTASEATAAHDGTLAEIRRKVEDPPRWWSFTPSLVGPEMPSGYRNVHASESTDPRLAGTFPRSIDPRDPQQPFASPFGKPGDLLWIAEEWALEDCGADGERVIWKSDRGAAWRSNMADRYYLDVDYPAEWQSAGTMPQWASRTTLRITGVRVERTGDEWQWVYSVEKA